MSEGFCEVDFSDASDDAERCEFYDTSTVKARKEHRCTECGGPIARGENYQRVAYKFEGEFSTDRICAPCQEAANEFGFHIVGGLLWSNFQEEWEQGAHIQSCLNRLTSVSAKEKMRLQWLKWSDEHRARDKRRREQLAALKSSGAVRSTPSDPS